MGFPEFQGVRVIAACTQPNWPDITLQGQSNIPLVGICSNALSAVAQLEAVPAALCEAGAQEFLHVAAYMHGLASY